MMRIWLFEKSHKMWASFACVARLWFGEAS